MIVFHVFIFLQNLQNYTSIFIPDFFLSTIWSKILKFFHSKIARKNIRTNFVYELYDKSKGFQPMTIKLRNRPTHKIYVVDCFGKQETICHYQ